MPQALPHVAEPAHPTETPDLSGTVERLVYVAQDTGYVVAEVRPEASGTAGSGNALATIVGQMPELQCGESVELWGRWEEHRQHGRQFRVQRCNITLPSSVHGLRQYLGSGLVKGIGPSMAQRIVERFGENTLDVLEHHSRRLREVEGIGKARAESIKAAWDEQRATREASLYLQSHGVSPQRTARLLKRYGSQAALLLRTNPYRLARDMDGIGFATADQMARNFGIANDDPKRLQAGLEAILLQREGDGHTASDQDALLQQAAQLLECPPQALEGPLQHLVESGLLEICEPGRYQAARRARAERIIAEALVRLHRARSLLPPIRIDAAITWAQERAGFTFAPEQSQALQAALEHPVCLLTGGPGTGKTTILRALGAILRAKRVQLRLASPTGRAAQKLAEATGLTTSTLHRLLNYDAAKSRFSHDAETPLKGTFFLVDETSMLDTSLAAAFLRAVPTGAHLLLVGDPDQLPSVGPGQVLRDLIECGQLPVVRLNQVFRQGERSEVVATAHRVLSGNDALPPLFPGCAAADLGLEVLMVHTSDAHTAQQQILELFEQHLSGALGLRPEALAEAVQVLTPQNKGPAGVQELNTALQGLFQGGQSPGIGRLLTGDKVMYLKNDYERGLFNGDLGTVLHTDAQGSRMRFGEREVELEGSRRSDVTLAYAMTIHKAQGSEFPVVVLPLVQAHYMLLQRQLLYTALTRARKQVILIGEPNAYRSAVRQIRNLLRDTGLPVRLKACFD